MDETRFWSIIESAWKTVDGQAETRRKLAAGEFTEDEADDLTELRRGFLLALQERLDGHSADDLLAFEHILEHKLYDIDRADIHECTDNSDDGFLYSRGFIIGMGRDYYEAVQARPSLATPGWRGECEDMCYMARIMYEEKFGEMPPSDVSIESCSNKAGWPDMD